MMVEPLPGSKADDAERFPPPQLSVVPLKVWWLELWPISWVT
jgi:hypothetical protein